MERRIPIRRHSKTQSHTKATHWQRKPPGPVAPPPRWRDSATIPMERRIPIRRPVQGHSITYITRKTKNYTPQETTPTHSRRRIGIRLSIASAPLHKHPPQRRHFSNPAKKLPINAEKSAPNPRFPKKTTAMPQNRLAHPAPIR